MDNGYTVKELVNEVRKEQRGAIEIQARILNSLENIDNHLEKLNSKVVTNSEKISGLQSEHTRMKSFVAGISMVIGMVWTAINFVFK